MVAPIGVLMVTWSAMGLRSNGSSRVQSGPICETEQVREVLGRVGEVTLTGSKTRATKWDLALEWIVTVPPPPKVLSPCKAGMFGLHSLYAL